MDPKARKIEFDRLPNSALVRQRYLLENVLPFSKNTLARKVKAGTFPKPRKLNDGNITCFRVADVRAWLEQQGKEGCQ